MENNADEILNTENVDLRNTSKSRSRKSKNEFKEKECEVIHYDKIHKTLDIKFDGYGIRIKNIETFNGDTVIVKYKSEIGKPSFEIKL